MTTESAGCPSPLPPLPERDGNSTTYLGLGSNLGAPADNIERAIAGIAMIDGVELQDRSALHHSKALGPTQPDYVNAVVKISTNLTPLLLLHRLQQLERQLGRTNCERWGARVIDIDILQMQDTTLYYEALTIPHPRMFERAFVMEPLAEIGGVKEPPAALLASPAPAHRWH